MSDTLLHVFSIFPIQDNIAQYLGEEDLKNLSSLGGIFANFYFDFNRELNLDQYDDEICSKFRKIENLHLRDNIQKQVVPKKVLSVLVSLEVLSIDNKIINLKECKKLKTLRCKDLGNLDNSEFPLTLKKLYIHLCRNIPNINIKHLANLIEIDVEYCNITVEAVNNFPEIKSVNGHARYLPSFTPKGLAARGSSLMSEFGRKPFLIRKVRGPLLFLSTWFLIPSFIHLIFKK
uniref:Uncharacterized protein n=1 Tax=Cacopsylla melanoneura TaxID=428564 RepID=A0A8D8SS77_9HEMI